MVLGIQGQGNWETSCIELYIRDTQLVSKHKYDRLNYTYTCNLHILSCLLKCDRLDSFPVGDVLGRSHRLLYGSRSVIWGDRLDRLARCYATDQRSQRFAPRLIVAYIPKRQGLYFPNVVTSLWLLAWGRWLGDSMGATSRSRKGQLESRDIFTPIRLCHFRTCLEKDPFAFQVQSRDIWQSFSIRT